MDISTNSSFWDRLTSQFKDRFTDVLANDVKVQTKCLRKLDRLKEIGRGTEGVVFSACRELEGCDIALKIQTMPRDFISFAQIVTLASEKNISPKLYEMWECPVIKGRNKILALFTITNFYPTTLKDVIENNWFDKKEWLLKKLGKLVRLLRKNGIVHNDLHPDNIVLNEKEIRIIDFGRSKLSKNPGTIDVKTLAASINELLRTNDIPDSINPNEIIKYQ